MRVEATAAPSQTIPPADKSSLQRLASVALSGDWFSDCMGLSACGSAEQFSLQKQNVKRGHRALQQYQERMKELRVEQEKKAAEASRWGFLSAVISVATAVIGTVVGCYNPAAGRVVSTLGASLAASFRVTGQSVGDQAAETHCRSMKMAAAKADAAEDGAMQMQRLNDMVVVEQAMGRQLMRLLGNEQQAAEAALRTGG